MKKGFYILVFLGLSFSAQSQFTIIPTGTSSSITDLVMHGDTLIVSGATNYFAKSYDMGNSIVPFTSPGVAGYGNFDFQIVNGNYYIVSSEGFPYDHNYILKSIDNGGTWITLYDTVGLFYTFTMLDTTFGIMAGTYGAYAMTNGNDSNWLLQDSLYSAILASETYGDSTVLMMSYGSMSYVSENRGQAWSWVSGTSYTHEEIQFLNADTIYAVAHKGTTNPTSYFYYSYNGGYSWSWVDIGFNDSTSSYDYYSRVFDLYFDSPQHGYIIGYNYDINKAVIFETNNYGLDWTMNPTTFSEELYDILNVNDSIAFLGGENGKLIKWNKSQGSCSVTLSSTAASCPTCCDACINVNIVSACPPFSLSWSPSDPTFPPCSACAGTTYIVTVYDDCGCSASDTITPDTVAIGMGYPELTYNSTMSLYPNPFTQSAIIFTEGIKYPSDLIVYDNFGRVIRQETITGTKYEFNRNNLAPGIYFYRVGNLSGKFIVSSP